MRRVALGVWLSAVLAGSASPLAGETVTEEEFLVPLAQEHPAVAGRKGPLAMALGARRAAAVLDNPRLDFSAEQPEDTPRESIWDLAWTPPLDGRRRLSIRASEAALGAARSGLEAELLAVRLEMRAAFAAWQAARERRDLLASQAQRLGELARRMAARGESGEESKLAARRFALAATEGRADVARAEAALARALGEAMAWNPDLPQGAVPVRPDLPEMAEGLTVAARPDLEALRLEVEEAELQERLSHRVATFPELVVGWKTIEDRDLELDGPIFGFAWTLPIADRRQAERLETRGRREAAEARLTLAEQRAEARLQAAQAAYARLRLAALAARSDVTNLEGVVRGAVAAYEAGESGVTDLLDTLRSVVSAKLAELDLFSAALEAHRQLEAVAGQVLTAGGAP